MESTGAIHHFREVIRFSQFVLWTNNCTALDGTGVKELSQVLGPPFHHFVFWYSHDSVDECSVDIQAGIIVRNTRISIVIRYPDHRFQTYFGKPTGTS